MIKFNHKGDFSKTLKFLKKTKRIDDSLLEKYAKKGIEALSNSTPVNTGLTASSWYYKIKNTSEKSSISFYNSNIQNGVPIAIILQYGHGTKNGGFVQGIDYINPALKPIFDNLMSEVWKEVTGI